MAKFEVVGPFEIDGVATGGTVEFGDDTDVNVEALLSAGHIKPVEDKPAKPPKAEG